MTATIINAIAVILGTCAGLLLKKKISDSFRSIVMTSSGVITLVLGLQMAQSDSDALTLALAVPIQLHVLRHLAPPEHAPLS